MAAQLECENFAEKRRTKEKYKMKPRTSGRSGRERRKKEAGKKSRSFGLFH